MSWGGETYITTRIQVNVLSHSITIYHPKMSTDEKLDAKVAVDSGSSNVDIEPGQADRATREDYGWNRGLSARAVIMLGLGGGIGLGLWIGTGTALAAGENSLP
jgi:amino acid permease